MDSGLGAIFKLDEKASI